jgi:hypothetical protein
MGFQMISPPMTSLAALVTMMPMIAVTEMVTGEAMSCDAMGACGVFAYRVQSDCPSVPAPHAPRIEVIPNMEPKPTLGAVLGWLNMDPTPWACETLLCHNQLLERRRSGLTEVPHQMRRPVQVPQKRKKHTTNGICSRSGLIRTAGMKPNIQTTSPIKSLVSRCEPGSK